MVESVQLATLYHLRTFITIYATEEPFIGWPPSGVVYFNILRIYIITGFVQCKSVGALSRDVLGFLIHNFLYAVFKT